MAAVTISGMLALEAKALATGWTEERLLDLAGARLGLAIGRFFPKPGTAIGYLGKGHNAGDAIVALKVLRDRFGWQIAVRPAFSLDQLAPLTSRKFEELGIPPLHEPPPWRDLDRPLLLLDGLLGSGSKGAMRDPLLPMAKEMEWLRQNAGARVAAVDLPSGIDADTGIASQGAVTADATFMIGSAKRGLLCGHATNHVGSLALVPVEVLSSTEPGDMELISPQTLESGKFPRPFDFHKGLAGSVAVVAGSQSYTGAAVLAATGALRGGAGLVTIYAPAQAAAVISQKCPPEIIVRGYSSLAGLADCKCDAMVIGCGLGPLENKDSNHLFELIDGIASPMVIDADALNQLARFSRCEILTERHVITPHPGEFRRLAPDLAELPRETAARAFVDRFATTLLLKGGRTLVARRNHPLWCNSTGSPGMATGGQGDLLAGVIGARLATGDAPLEAAALSAWICGRSAEIALTQDETSEESITPSDVALHLGAAFRDWNTSGR